MRRTILLAVRLIACLVGLSLLAAPAAQAAPPAVHKHRSSWSPKHLRHATHGVLRHARAT